MKGERELQSSIGVSLVESSSNQAVQLAEHAPMSSFHTLYSDLVQSMIWKQTNSTSRRMLVKTAEVQYTTGQATSRGEDQRALWDKPLYFKLTSVGRRRGDLERLRFFDMLHAPPIGTFDM